MLDLARAEGKALLAAILAKADVFVQNLKPGAIAKLGFPLAELRRAHPRLVITLPTRTRVYRSSAF